MRYRTSRLLLVLMVFAQITGLVVIPLPLVSSQKTTSVQAALPIDLVNHWASDTFAYWMDQGVLGGYEDGTTRPDASLERCELIAFLNRAMGYSTPGARQFSDVYSADWYANDFLIARQAGYFSGFENNYAFPAQRVTRAEAATLLCRIFSMMPQTPHDDLSRFADYENALVVSPARSSLEALVERGFLSGFPDNTLRPEEPLTRAELMSMFGKIMPLYLNRPGVSHNNNNAQVDGNTVIRQASAELRNATINGDLIIAPGAGEGSITLTDVTVNGRILLAGSGTVDLTNCRANDLIVAKRDGRRVIVDSSNSHFDRLVVQSPSDIALDNNSTLKTLIVASEALDSRIKLDSDPRSIEVFSPQAVVTLSSSSGSSPGGSSEVTPPVTPPTVPPGSSGVEILDPNRPQVWMPIMQYVITIGSQVYIDATVYPLNADSTLAWSTSDSKVATISSDGMVTGIAEGRAIISAVSKANPQLSASATVIVEYRNIASIAINNTSLTLAVKKTATLTATLFPLIGTKPPKDAVSWFSGDPKIATVDNSGKVTGVAIGKTSIYAYVTEVPSVQARSNISVIVSGTLIDTLNLSDSNVTMMVGESRRFDSVTLPTKATLQHVNWWASDSSVVDVNVRTKDAKVDSTFAEVKAVTPGQIVLYAETTDGSDLSASCRITVIPAPARGMRLEIPRTVLEVGSRVDAQVIFDPPFAANREVRWESTNPQYISITKTSRYNVNGDPIWEIWAHRETLTQGMTVFMVAYAESYASNPANTWAVQRQQITVSGVGAENITFDYGSNLPLGSDSHNSIRVNMGRNGNIRNIAMNVLPRSASDKKLLFESLDESIFTVQATDDITATIRGVRPGVSRIRVTHETTGLVREFWVVVASDAFVEFLASLDASTSGYNALTEPQRFFRFFPDLEYETAAFFYRFQEVGGHLPSIQRQHTFYGLINAWASAFTGIPEERDGRMPDEARAMAMVLRDMDQINYSLSNASNANLSMIANTVKNLWNVSEAGFIWDNSNYFTKLGQYLFYSNGDNMLPSPSSTAVTQILNLAHMLARSDVSPTATMPGANLTYVQKASSFVTDYMDTASSGVAATIQITKLNDTPGARSEQARRMVFETISYRSGALIPKEDELQLLGLGYLYGDLDGLVTQPLFNPGLVANIIGNYRVYFPNLAGYLSSSGFTPEYFLAYRTYSTLHPDKKPAEVIAAVNGASSEYRTLLNQLDGNYAVFKDRVRIEEIIGDYNIITSPTNISWRPTEVALYRRDNLPPLYVTYSGSNLEFYWKETGTQLPPQDYGQFTLLIDVYPPLGSSVREKVATLEVPVYIHGTAWTNKRDTLKAALAATYPLNYNDLVAVRTPVKPDVLPPELRGGQEAYLLRAADQVQQNREIAEGWLDYFTWYHGDIVLAKIIESLDDPGDLSEFWPKLRTMAYDIRARDSIIEDYKLWKFFDIYLQRWLNIESGGRLLFDDFLWHPGDFLDLGPLDPREYIIGLSKMMINPGDAYNFDTNRKGYVTDYPLESHRTGLFFSNIYAFRSVNNVRNVGEMIERYLVLANRGTTAVTPLELASTWLNNLLNDRTIFETYTYKDAGIPLPGSVGWNVYVPERSSISANLWEHFRINSDELLPLFTLPLKTTPDLRVTVMPGIVLIGSTVEYTDTGSSVLKNITFNDRFGRPLLNVIYNLEKRHDYQGLAINTPWLRKDFRSSWLDKGSVFVFDFPRGTSSSSPINTFFYYPLHFWEDTHSYASSNRIELGRNPFYDNNTLLGWNDELQYLLLEVLSLHNTFGYSRPLRLLQQEMGGMLQPHDGLNWNLTADDETLVPTQSEMQANLRRLWEGRNLFDKWWGDVYLRSQGTRAQQLYTYQNRSATGVARFIPAVASISSYVYDNPRTYAAPTAVQDAYYINGNYRLQSIPIPSNLNYERGDWLVDPRSASFKLLNPPDRYFSTEWTGGGDQNYIGFSLIPRRDTRYDSLGSRYDLPRVDLLEQIFYRHGWYGVMGYLSEQREATSLEAMVYAAVNSNLGGLTNSVYGSWTEWTLQEWQDRIWKISDAQLSLVSTAESSMAGLANWEWEKLIYLMDDPGYLKEFFVTYLREKTVDFTAYDLQVIASPGQPLELRADRATTFEALNCAQRMLDGKPHPLTPGVPLFNPRDALWLLNVTARAGDYVYNGPAGEENYRTVADNLKLLAFGGASTVLNDTDTLALDPNDAYVDELIRQALRIDTPNPSSTIVAYLEYELTNPQSQQNMKTIPIDRVLAYGYENQLSRLFFDVYETDPVMLNLFVHPLIDATHRDVILAVYGTPEQKRERDAYLWRVTNPNYDPKYETAYFNYSFIYDGISKPYQYDTKQAQDLVVAFINQVASINGNGKRYGQDQVSLINREMLPESWRQDPKMTALLRNFFEHNSASANAGSHYGEPSWQVDISIIREIYDEFIQGKYSVFAVDATGKSGISYRYAYGSSANYSYKSMYLDFHDLYHRMEIARLPLGDANYAAEKNRALHDYMTRGNGRSFSFIVSQGSDVYRVVTLTATSDTRGVDKYAMAVPTDVKRLGVPSVNASAYLWEGSSIIFENTVSFDTGAVENGQSFYINYSKWEAASTRKKYFPLLLYTYPARGVDTNMYPWTVSVTELESNSFPLDNGRLHFMTNLYTADNSTPPTDYVTGLIRVDLDRRWDNDLLIPELMVFSPYSPMNFADLQAMMGRLASRNFRSIQSQTDLDGLASLTGGSVPALLETLVMLGYDFEEILFINDNETLKKILEGMTHRPGR